MAEYRTPGVYCQQVDSPFRPLEALGTRVAAFVGCAPDAKKDIGIARPINDWSQFCKHYFPEGSAPTDLAYAVYGFYACGGGRCYISNIGKDGKVAGDGRKGGGVSAFDTFDEISMVAAPGYTDAASYRALIDHAEQQEDRMAILDCPPSVGNVDELTKAATAPAKGDDGKAAAAAANKAKGPPRSSFAACYYPWLILPPCFGEDGNREVPPSGHMCGIYARNDEQRGVHCPPANYSVRTAIGLTARVTRDQQGLLNESGINCIRDFTQGPKVWGARTLSADPQWRYVNVRRLYMMLRESIVDGSAWAVFSTNDQFTRNSLAFSCRAFLKRQWMNGALVGNTPEEAFFVQCNEENNPPETIAAGQMCIDIGICPVQTTEFIIFRLGLVAGANTETES